MNTNQQISDRSTIDSEASAWLARLDGDDISAEDQAEFTEWMGKSPLHQTAIRELADVWGDLNILVDLLEPIEAERAREKKATRGRANRFSWNWVSVSATSAMGFIILFGLMNTGLFVSDVQQMSIETIVGKHVSETLSDGSTVTLNTNSRIEVDFTKEVRAIHLLQGEALFDVKSDKDRPFIVYAGGGVVKAVGTVFSVHVDQSVVNVAVTEGAVELAPVTTESPALDSGPGSGSAVAYIKSGHKAILENERTTIEPVAMVKLQSEMSWQDGLLMFSGESLEQVVKEVSRYTITEIVIRDPDIRDIPIGGIFPSGDVDALLDALESGFGIEVQRVDAQRVELLSSRNR